MSAKTAFRQIRVASLLLVVLVAACASQTKNVTITTVPPGAEIELAELTKLLLITSDPPGATVHLDGSEIGITPLQMDLSFARIPEHLMMVTKEGFENSGVRQIRYEPRDSTAYHFDLQKEMAPLNRRFKP